MHLCSGTTIGASSLPLPHSPPSPTSSPAAQAVEKLSAGFQFEKQMKKFNDVELRRGSITHARRGAARAEWILSRDKTAFKPEKCRREPISRVTRISLRARAGAHRRRRRTSSARRHMWT